MALAALGACGGDEDGAADDTFTRPAATNPTVICREVENPKARAGGGQRPPEKRLDTSATYVALVTTTCGTFEITLDQKASPKATASFVALAQRGFFEDTVFHRIVPGFVIQGGDPTQLGNGGPGYTTVDTPDAGTTYGFGTVAMAKAGAEPPGAAGSQFFVVTAPDAGLPPDYAVIGRVSKGAAVVRKIGGLGDAMERPTQAVLVESISIDER